MHRQIDAGWEREANRGIRRVVTLLLAEAQGHHPELEVGWGKLVVTFTTHAVGVVPQVGEQLTPPPTSPQVLRSDPGLAGPTAETARLRCQQHPLSRFTNVSTGWGSGGRRLRPIATAARPSISTRHLDQALGDRNVNH